MPQTPPVVMNGTPQALAPSSQQADSPVIPAQTGTIFNVRRIVDTLETLMTRVTEQEATSDTVTAACRAAGEIRGLLALTLEAEKLRREDAKIQRAEERLRARP